MPDIMQAYTIGLLLLFIIFAVMTLFVVFNTLEQSSLLPLPLTTRLARFLFNLAWSIDYREVSRIIEEDCEYVSCDEAYEYVCANMGD